MIQKTLFYTILILSVASWIWINIPVHFLNRRKMCENCTEQEERIMCLNQHGFKKSDRHDVLPKTSSVIEQQRSRIKQELQSYVAHPSLQNRNLSLMNIESGGEPVRVLLLSTWRSGSSFLGALLASHPAVYYIYEPFYEYLGKQIKDNLDLGLPAIKQLANILSCNYSAIDKYNNGEAKKEKETEDRHVAEVCKFHRECLNPDLLSRLCSIFPFQVMKSVRLRVSLLDSLLATDKSNMKVVLLIRDPRATMASRYRLSWCINHGDCIMESRFCQDLVNDYDSIQILSKKYPEQIRVIRYEDLISNLEEKVKSLLNSLQMTYHENIKSFIQSHTKMQKAGYHSTFRNLDKEDKITSWIKDLQWHRIHKIQTVCKNALSVWQYNILKPYVDLHKFNSIQKWKYLEDGNYMI